MEVLDYWRQREPQFATVDDATLTEYLGQRQPEFLQDPDFKTAYEGVVHKRAQTTLEKATPFARYTFPEAFAQGAPASTGALQAGEPLETAQPATALAGTRPPRNFIAQYKLENLEKDGYSPELASAVRALEFEPPPGIPKPEVSEADRAAVNERFMAEQSSIMDKATSPLRASPLDLLTPTWREGELAAQPRGVQRAVAYSEVVQSIPKFFTSLQGLMLTPVFATGPGRVVFGADMLHGAYTAKKELDAELAKPENERDYYKIGQLEGGMVLNSIFGFTLLGKETARGGTAAVRKALPALPEGMFKDLGGALLKDRSLPAFRELLDKLKPQFENKAGVPYQRQPMNWTGENQPIAPIEQPPSPSGFKPAILPNASVNVQGAPADQLKAGMDEIEAARVQNQADVAAAEAEIAARQAAGGQTPLAAPATEPTTEQPSATTPVSAGAATPTQPGLATDVPAKLFSQERASSAAARLKAKAAKAAADAAAPVLPGPRPALEVSPEEQAAIRAAREADARAQQERATAAAAAAEAARTEAGKVWRPPKAEPVEPVPLEEAGAEQIYTVADAVRESERPTAPPFSAAVAALRRGRSPAQVLADWGGGQEYDALHSVLEQIGEARGADLVRLKKAYQNAFVEGAPNVDRTLAGLQENAREGQTPAGGVPETPSDLIERLWEHHARPVSGIDREATAMAQEAADYEAFNASLTLEGNTVKSGSQPLGEVRETSRGKSFVPAPEAERLPPEYQAAVLKKAGFETEYGMPTPSRFAQRANELDSIAMDLYGKPYDELGHFNKGNVEVTLEAEDAAIQRRQQPAEIARRQRDVERGQSQFATAQTTAEPARAVQSPTAKAVADLRREWELTRGSRPNTGPYFRKLSVQQDIGRLWKDMRRDALQTINEALATQEREWTGRSAAALAKVPRLPNGDVNLKAFKALPSADLDAVFHLERIRNARAAARQEMADLSEVVYPGTEAYVLRRLERATGLRTGAEPSNRVYSQPSREIGMPQGEFPGVGTSTPEFDPTILRDLTEVAGEVLEGGATDFPAFARAMSQALDGQFPQYYHAAYEQVRFYTEAWHLRDRMTPQEEAETYDATGSPNRISAAGGGQELSGTVGGTGGNVRRRPGLRVVDFRDLPAPRPIIRSGEYSGPGGAGLDEVQRFAANAALTAFENSKPAYLLGDGTGVGKTGTELAIAAQSTLRTKLPSLIVTQSLPIIENRFKADAVKLGIPTQGVDFITYNDLSAGKVPTKEYGVVIYDEAHNLKNAGSLRETFSKGVNARHKVFATATPMDGPAHASYFLSELTGKTKQQIADKLGFHYEQKVVDGKSREFAVLNKGTSWGDVVDQIKRLRNQAVRDGQLIRREYPFYGNASLRKAPQYSPEIAKEQQDIKDYWDKQIDAARPGSNYKRNLAGQKTLELSRWAEWQKFPAVLKAALEDYNAGKHVIIFAEQINPSFIKGTGKTVPGFLTEMGRELDKRGIKYARVFEDSPKEKARAAEDFQRRGVKVLLATPKSGGAGLDMDDQIGNAPRQAHAATLNFSADVFDQMLGRVSRRNTASPANFHVWISPESFSDGRRVQVADRKLRVLRNIQAGEDLDTSEFETMGTHGFVAGNAVVTPPRGGAARAASGLPDEHGMALRAHHGTPHEVEQFSTAKIGTGEGAQVYGWGLYFAENPAVASEYAKKLSRRPEITVGGRVVDQAQTNPVASVAAKLAALRSSYDYTNTKVSDARVLAEVTDNINSYLRVAIERDDSRVIRSLSQEVEALKNMHAEGIRIKQTANEYTVTLNVEPEELLDWDKPLSEQSAKIQAAVRGLFKDNVDESRAGEAFLSRANGASIHATAAAYLGDRMASQAMARRGIRGIRYLDQGSRGRYSKHLRRDGWVIFDNQTQVVVKDSLPDVAAADAYIVKYAPKSQTYNYVIFDEKDIRITHKNGQAVKPSEAAARADLEHGMPALEDQGGFSFDAPESVAEQAARLAREETVQKRKDAQTELAARAAKRLTGTSGDLGQADLLGAPEDLWAAREGEHGAPSIPAGGTPGLPVELNRTVPGQASIPQINAALEAISVAAGGRTPIRSGRYYGPNRGIYREQSEVVRLRRIDDLPAAAHEIAHDLSKQVFGSVSAGGTAGGSAAALAEMEALGKALYGSTKPLAGYAGEGWAEFLRTWLSADDAANVAPAMTRWFENDFLPNNPPLAKALNTARGLITTHRLSGATARAQAQLVREPSALRRVAQALGKFVGYQAQVEKFAPIEKLAAEANRKRTATGASPLPPSEDPFKLASWKRGSAGATVERMATSNMVDVWGNPTGPSLKEVLSPVQGKRNEFMLYLFARRAMERWNKTKVVTDRVTGAKRRVADPKNPGISLADAEHIYKLYSSPEFSKAAQGYYDWWDGVLEYAVQADPAMADVVSKIKQGSYDYAPLARMIDPAKAKQAAANAQSNPFFRMHGSGLPVKDIFDQTFIGAAKIINRANRSLVSNAIVKLANIEGMGHVIERIPRGRIRNMVGLDQIRQQLEDLGIDTSAMTKDKLIEYWTPADLPKGSAPIIAVGRGNARQWFQVSPELYEAMDGLQAWSLKNAFPGMPHLGAVLDLMLGAPARMFRLGTTGLRPAFSLVTNPTRDLQTLMVQSSVNPARAAAAYPAALAGVIREGFGGKGNAYTQAFYDLGAHMGQPLGLDISHTKRVSNELFHGRILRVAKNPVDHLRQLFSITEAAPRVAELKAVADKIGWKPGTPITPDQAVAMGLAAKRVTVDFSAMGDVSRILNQAVPFYNPAIQGLRSFARTIKEHPGRTAALGALFTAATLANWWKNKDKEWYKAMPYRERYLYSNIDDGTNVWRIPRPFEWGMAFGAVPEALMDAWYRRDTRSAKEVLGPLIDSVNPMDYPVMLKAAKEQWQNRVAYWDKPIVPESMTGLPARDQKQPYTTRLALTINQVFPNLSPLRVDAFIRSYLGGAGPDALQMIGLGSPRSGREFEPSDIPAFGVLFRRGGEFNAQNQHITDFYDLYGPMQAKLEAFQYNAKRAALRREPLPPVDVEIMRAGIGQQYAAGLGLLMQMAGNVKDNDARAKLYRAAGRWAEDGLAAMRNPAAMQPVGQGAFKMEDLGRMQQAIQAPGR